MILLLLFLTISFAIVAPCTQAVHVIGMAGHGKSTVAKSLTNNSNIVSGNIETTMEISMVVSELLSMIIYDYPGFGTPKYPIEYWINKYEHHYNNTCSIILLVIGNRIYEQHKIFWNNIKIFDKIIIVRSQINNFPIDPEIFQKYFKEMLEIKEKIDILYYNANDPEPFLKKIKSLL